MRHGRHSFFPPLAMLMMIAASLIFFLPAAISMNSQAPFAASEATATASANADDLAAIKNEKGSLSLKTAAIVGSSAAALAAVLVRE